MTKRPLVGIIGAGVVGSALAVALSRAGYPIAAISSRRWESAVALGQRLGTGTKVARQPQDVVDRSDSVFLAVPDGAIRPLAEVLRWRPGTTAVHLSGVGTSAWLASAAQAGARTGSCHPLQTFAGIDEAIELLPESTFAIEAPDDLAADLADLVQSLGARSIRLKAADKPIYHLAAVLVSNYLVTLTQLASELWSEFGGTPEEARRALVPLIQGTTRGLAAIGPPDCLTGPVARGDLGTVEQHRQVLLERRPDLLAAYGELGRLTVPIAVAKGRIDTTQAEEMRELFERCRETASLT